jgi:2-haloacid dehalogenase
MTTEAKVCIFDAYGTLFDLHSATARYAKEVGPQAMELSQLWRNKQIEYSWIRSGMARMPDGWRDFWSLTEEALTYSMAALKIETAGLREKLLNAYMTLDTYPEVTETLKLLKQIGIRTAILSNGTQKMLRAALAATGVEDLVDAIFSADDVKRFKPSAALYNLVPAHFDVTPQQAVFHSSNQWDAAGAAAFGFQIVLIDRYAQPREYSFVKPLAVVQDLKAVPDILSRTRRDDKLQTAGLSCYS